MADDANPRPPAPAVTQSVADPAATTGGGAASPAAGAPPPGDRYALGEEIARGGMEVNNP